MRDYLSLQTVINTIQEILKMERVNLSENNTKLLSSGLQIKVQII